MTATTRHASEPRRFKCSHCGHVIQVSEGALPRECPECQTRLKSAKAVPVPVVVAPPPPIVVQMPTDPFDYIEEKKADLRERRDARQEDRRYYREDRNSNMVGNIGFGMNVTVMLVLVSGWLFAKTLPAYLYITAGLSVPVAITGLIMCIFASLMPGRQRIIAVTGLAVGAIVVLMMLPFSFAIRDLLAK